MEALPKRKHPRLKEYDYSSPNSYFITICSKDKQCVFSEIHLAEDTHSPQILLSKIGAAAEKYLYGIEIAYPNITLDKYVIMPNHIHILLSIYEVKGTPNTDIKNVIKSFKSLVTKEIGKSIWQNSFYDSIIDEDNSFENVWWYIDENPAKWLTGKGNDF